MAARRTDARVSRVRGMWRWSAAWLCAALPCWAYAAQDNVLGVARHAAQNAAEHGSAAPTIDHAGQSGLTSARSQPDAERIEQTEQRNLLAPEAVGAAAQSSVRASARAGEPASGVSMPAEPDERPLWNLLKADRLAAYDHQVAALSHDFPSWTPIRALVDERARRQRAQEIEAALNGEPGELRLLLARAPDEFGCAHIDRVWKAADVFARAAEPDAVQALYRTVIPACTSDADRIATLYRAEHQLSAARFDELIATEAAQGRRAPNADAAFQRLRYERALTALAAASPDPDDAAARLVHLAPAIRTYRDGPAATQAGWIEFAQHRLDAAADWFDTALSFTPDATDAAIGLAQVRVAQHDLEAADKLLAQPSLAQEPRARDLRAQIALARADDAYRQHRYPDSLHELDLAAAQGAPAARTDVLRGWNLYALGRYEEAEQVFRASYERSHDDDSAEGLALCMNALGLHAAPAATDTGALRAYELALGAQRLYYRKAFLAAQADLHDALGGAADRERVLHYVPADLTGIDAASVSAGLDWADHIGAAGQGRLETFAPTLRGEWISGTRQYEMRYRQLFLHNGTSTVRAEELQAMVADTVRVGDAHSLDWRASFGGTQGRPSGMSLDGQASIGQQAAWGAWSAYAGMTPVRDSLLSWRGAASPDGSDKWGAVRRAASGARARWQIAPRWNVSAGAEAQWLTGMNVIGNEGVSADLSAGYDFRVPGFDYLSAGPAMHYLAYRRNENFYGQGQGGYYSPQSSTSAGIALQLLSNEGRRLQWQGSFETGWNTSYQADAPCFPLGLPNGVAGQTTCRGGHDRGPYAHAQVSVAVRLAPRWQAGALVDMNVTPGRDKQVAALAFIRYFLEPRAAVFSRDLPHNTRDFYLQLDDDRN
jgi:hypothetical protein